MEFMKLDLQKFAAQTIISGVVSPYTPPTATYTVTLECTSRTETYTTTVVNVSVRFNTSGSWLGTGYVLIAHLFANGYENTFELKGWSDAWSGVGPHTGSATFNIPTSAWTTSMSDVSFSVTYGDNDAFKDNTACLPNTAASTTVTLPDAPQIAITFNANGGTGAPNTIYTYPNNSATIPSQTSSKASTTPTGSVTYNANGGTTTKTGDSPIGSITSYPFSSWNTQQAGNGTDLYPNHSYTFYASTPLYAQYSTSTGYAYGTLPTASQCTRSGYKLLGWSASSTATTATYNPGASYTTNSNDTLYAVWAEQYTLTYDANGGTGVPSNQTFYAGESVTLSNTTPTRTGSSTSKTATFNANGGSTTKSSESGYIIKSYDFDKWYNGYSGCLPGYTYTFNSDVTLKAGWYVSTTNPTITFPTTAQCTRTHYTLLGWSTNSSATTATYSPGEQISITDSQIYYAVWQEKAQYTVTYDANGGSGAPSSQTYYDGDSITLSSTSPTKADTYISHTFTYNANGGSTTYSSYTNNETRGWRFDYWIYNNEIYYPSTEYTFSGNATLSAYYANNSVSYYNPPFPTAAQCTRSGYTLLGWSTSSSATIPMYQPGETLELSFDEIFYAVWEETPTKPIYTKTSSITWKSGPGNAKISGAWTEGEQCFAKSSNSWVG